MPALAQMSAESLMRFTISRFVGAFWRSSTVRQRTVLASQVFTPLTDVLTLLSLRRNELRLLRSQKTEAPARELSETTRRVLKWLSEKSTAFRPSSVAELAGESSAHISVPLSSVHASSDQHIGRF